MSEWPKVADQSIIELDFNNVRIVTEVLVEGTDEQLEALRLHIEKRLGRPFSQQEILLYRDFARQRDRHIEESDTACKLREATHPQATDLEYQVGAYKERLEKPSREAVFTLRQKGYSSYESGFGRTDSQYISFKPSITELANHAFSSAVEMEAARLGAELTKTENRVGFKMTRLLSDEELNKLWNLIAADLPIIDPPQANTLVKTAEYFREQQDALKASLGKK